MGFDEMTASGEKVNLGASVLQTVVSISADAIFEYRSGDGSVTLYHGGEDGFYEKTVPADDLEQRIKEDELVFEDDLDSFEQLCDNIRSGVDRTAFELRFSHDGEYRWYRVKMKTLRDEAAESFTVTGKLEDVSDLKNAERRLIEKAERDPLTRIYNKATTKRLIKNYLRTDSRDNFDAFIIIDVDNFKQINDTFGHLFGDSILVDLSQEMQDLFRSNDVVGRVGGDEFIVFLRGLNNVAHAQSKANDICKIFDLLYDDENGTRITGSLGISIFPRDGDTFDELYKKADTALYASKRAGKSCSTLYDESKDNSRELPSLPRVEQYRSGVDFLKPITEFENSLLNYMLDVSENSGIAEAAMSVFEKAGKHFTLGRISALVPDGQGGFTVKFQWHGKRSEPTQGETARFSEKEAAAFLRRFDKNGICCVENTGVSDGAFERFLSGRGTVSCIVSAKLSPDGGLSGMLALEECVSPKVWSIEEARTVNLLKKLYFGFLEEKIN